jgi:PEGA domain
MWASPVHAQDRDSGTITVRVRPAGADVLIDGERWTGPTADQRLIVQVTAGRHRVEIQKAGYQRFSTDVTVRGGETVPLNVSLAAAAPLSTEAPPRPQAPIRLERGDSGFVIAPDFKTTRLDGRSAGLAGVYGGRVIDGELMIGAGAYWRTNGARASDMAYGGAVVEWRQHTDRLLGFSVRGLAGVGRTSQSVHFADVPADGDRAPEVRFRLHQDFFIAEPQADLILRIANQLHLHMGVGYRLTSGQGHGVGPLNGVTGSVSVQIGR